MGGKGEWFSGTTIKDTWTKPRRLESGEGGEDGWCGEIKRKQAKKKHY